jgi:hypothetical protein
MDDLQKLTIRLRGYRLPSLNQILGVGLWHRVKVKKEAQDAFLSALQRGDVDCSMRTISSPSSLLIASDTAGQFLRTLQNSLASNAAKRKSVLAKRKKRSLK